jgi:iron complex transport system ATP-binding protein
MTLQGIDLTVTVKDKYLIRDISIEVYPGEIHAVIGPNGAGKSTLLKALSGDLKPEHGSVLMNGKPLRQWRLRDRARVRGILAQSSNLTFGFTVLQVVLMGRGPHTSGRESRRDYEIAQAALQECEVLHLEDRLYTTLSGGERQRVQLARVLTQIWEPVNDMPRYLLLDEPTNNLDLTHQHKTLQIAREFADNQVAVFVILHDLNIAAEYADRITVLKDGERLNHGPTQDVLTTETINTAFNMPVMVINHPLHNRPLIVPITTSELVEE